MRSMTEDLTVRVTLSWKNEEHKRRQETRYFQQAIVDGDAQGAYQRACEARDGWIQAMRDRYPGLVIE